MKIIMKYFIPKWNFFFLALYYSVHISFVSLFYSTLILLIVIDGSIGCFIFFSCLLNEALNYLKSMNCTMSFRTFLMINIHAGKNCCFNDSRIDFYLEYEPNPSSSKNLHHLFQSTYKFSDYAKYSMLLLLIFSSGMGSSKFNPWGWDDKDWMSDLVYI